MSRIGADLLDDCARGVSGLTEFVIGALLWHLFYCKKTQCNPLHMPALDSLGHQTAQVGSCVPRQPAAHPATTNKCTDTSAQVIIMCSNHPSLPSIGQNVDISGQNGAFSHAISSLKRH